MKCRLYNRDDDSHEFSKFQVERVKFRRKRRNAFFQQVFEREPSINFCLTFTK